MGEEELIEIIEQNGDSGIDGRLIKNVEHKMSASGSKSSKKKGKSMATLEELEKVEFLGDIVSIDGVEVDPTKIEAVKSWPTPKTASEVRSFLGLAGCYGRFVEGFSKIATPLTNLIRKMQKFVWPEKREGSFQTLKDQLITAPVLCVPNNKDKLVVYCDASKQGLGCVLM
ncbi:uncharacterized mitochondrial protein AtMg00860-like [Cannabis sativa]|uniref:uncharacterized mitochondrial protein AtMg00860-like n=1 Tax=Cannabis sativa TaxID=3483 RepID=UPI0029C9F3D5|nr:uncharacterized mitochondrial protein AtMg00860-like [Cannabis sativa]